MRSGLPPCLVLTVLLAACAGGARLQGQTVLADGLSYGLGPTPGRWQRISVEGNDVAWYDPATGGVVHVDHACERVQDVPLPALVQQLLIGFTQREVLHEETVPFDGREARHVVVRARLDGVPRTLELFVLKKDGCVYDLGYVAPPDRFEAGREAFQAFVQGFHTRQSPLGASR